LPVVSTGNCLACHGDIQALSWNDRSVLLELDPNEETTGFRVADLRGAVVATFIGETEQAATEESTVRGQY